MHPKRTKSTICMLTQALNILDCLRAKVYLVLITLLCRFCQVFGQITHPFNVGDQILDLKTVSLLSQAEIFTEQAIDKVLQDFADRIDKFILLFQHPLYRLQILLKHRAATAL